MEKYGCTIRKIRLSKGFSQKETYSGLLSKSYSIDFEKGKYDIKFSIMLKILKRLMISVEELLLIHNHYQETPINKVFAQLNRKKFENNPNYALNILKIISDELKENDDYVNYLEYWQLMILQSIYSNSQYNLSNEYICAKQKIQNHLFNMETWTLSELRLFSDMHFLFDNTKIKTSLFLTAWKSIEKYQYHPEFLFYISHLLTNNLFFLICTKQFDLAQKVMKRLYELTDDMTMMTWKVMLFYLEGLYFYAIGERQKGLQLIDKAKLICNLTENKNIIEQIELGLKLIQNDYHPSI